MLPHYGILKIVPSHRCTLAENTPSTVVEAVISSIVSPW